MKTLYKVKGIGKEATIESKVLIFVEDGKIAKVQDKWNGNLPESSIANVSSLFQLLNPFWWERYAEGWLFWTFSWVWGTSVWNVRRISPCRRDMGIASMGCWIQCLPDYRSSVASMAPPCRTLSGFPRMPPRTPSAATRSCVWCHLCTSSDEK